MEKYFVLYALLLIVISHVEGIRIAPPVPVMGSQAGAVSLSCNSEDLTQGFSSIVSMQLKRRRNFETQHTLLATISAVPDGGHPAREAYIKEGSPLDNREGVFLDGVLKTDNLEASYLTVEIAQVNLLCTDEAEYQCSIVFYATDGNIQTQTTLANMTIFVAPKDITLSVTKDGLTLDGGIQARPSELNVGDIITLACSGSIGSNPSIEYTWLRSSFTGPDYIPYTPLQPSDENKGEVPSAPTDCMYSRTATLLYNISLEDANRNVFGFQCQARYSVSTLGAQEVTSSTYFIKALGGTVPNPGGNTDVSSASSGDAGMIAGIVVGVLAVLVLVVLLVYFLWYRRRGGAGETYRTKEEQGSSNPNLTDPEMYTTVDKNKSKGYENRGMDDHKPSHRNNFENDHRGRRTDRGNRNYGMDHEDDDDYHSRDGSPTMHMSSGPIGTGV